MKLKSSFLPVNVTGLIGGTGVRRGMALALALNGKIAAVGYSAQLKGNRHVLFSFFAPPEYFRDGRNDAQVFVVSGSGASLQLARIV